MNRIQTIPTDLSRHASPRDLGEALLEIIRTSAADLVPKGLGRVVEVGCGPGRVLEKLAVRSPGLLVGVDRKISAGDPPGKRFQARFIQADLTALPLPDASFDAVVCVNVSMTLTREQMKRGVGELLRITRPQGQILFHIANVLNPVLGTRTWWRRAFSSGSHAYTVRDVERFCRSHAGRVEEVISIVPARTGSPVWNRMHHRFVKKFPLMSPILILKVRKH